MKNKVYVLLFSCLLNLFLFPSITTFAVGSIKLSEDEQWIEGLPNNYEYVTESAYSENSGETANSLIWTSLTGGTRLDGSKYASFKLVENHKLQVSSAWYGENVYFREKGTSGKGTVISIPEYSQLKEQYKKAIKVFNAYPPDSGGESFYDYYITAISDSNSYLLNTKEKINIQVNEVSIINFNKVPTSYLTDAEGNYIYDLVAIGANTDAEPDISGAAAWVLRDYIDEGYGFLIGHDTIYGYGGVHPDPNYTPDKTDTGTPMYVLNTKTNGHWNLNWLMGTNELYYNTSPYNSDSLILALGDYTDKSTLYGDGGEDSKTSTLKITATLDGDPKMDIDARSPINYPYSTHHDGSPFGVGSFLYAGSTHTNQQLAYGKIWLEFASNTSAELGAGKLVTDRNDGLIGSNNFYLTTNGNIGLNQIGHSRENLQTAKLDECRILANTIMYLSQREPCQVCASEQNGHDTVHDVTRISSVEDLAKIGNPKYKLTYPSDGCYTLIADITLPDDWKPIVGFGGHFHANNHSIETNGKDVFEKTGMQGGNAPSWNLGTDPNNGYPYISNSHYYTTTGIARVHGTLHQLFGNGSNADYFDYTIKLTDANGEEYSIVTDREGKYTFSNLPCDGKTIVAHVYDRNGNEITEHGKITANVPKKFWDTNETLPLKLESRIKPLKNLTIYEDETASFTAEFKSEVLPDKITWYYKTPDFQEWNNIAYSTSFTPKVSVVLSSGIVKAKLSTPLASLELDDYLFKAVFELDGKIYDTFSEKTDNEDIGKLTVLEQPYSISAVKNVEVWQGETATFTASLNYYLSLNNELKARWQYRANEDCAWESVEGSKIVKNVNIRNSVRATGDRIKGYENTSVLTISNVPTDIQGYQFRAVFEFVRRDKTFESDEANKTVHEGKISVLVKSAKCVVHPKNVMIEQSSNNTTGNITYTATFEYTANSSNANISWQFKENPNAEYTDISRYRYSKNIQIKEPIEIRKNVYQVTTILTLHSPPKELDSDNTHYYFRASFNNGNTVYSGSADISFHHAIDIVPNEPVVQYAPDGKKLYTFPSLQVFAPQGVRSFYVYFDENSRLAVNTVSATTVLNGVTQLPNNKGFEYNSDRTISQNALQEYLRNLTFTIGQEDAVIEWNISYDKRNDFDVYSGKYYEYVPHSGVTWTQSYELAKSRYNSVLQAQGKLASIKTQEQQDLVHSIVGNKYAWLGVTNDTNYAKMLNVHGFGWIDGTALSYSKINQWQGSGNYYVQMKPDGNWLGTQNNTTTTISFVDKNNVSPSDSTVYSNWTSGSNFNAYGTINGSHYLEHGHYYYVAVDLWGYGADSVSTKFEFPALNFAFLQRYSHPSYSHWTDAGEYYVGTNVANKYYSGYGTDYTIAQFTGTSGWYSYSAYGHLYCYVPYSTALRISGIDIIDLTAAYGTNSGISLVPSYYRTLFGNDFVKNNAPVVQQVVSTSSKASGYVVEYLVSDNAPTHTASSATATSELEGYNITIPPQTVQHTDYRANTDVYLSCEIIGLENIHAENTAWVKFIIANQNGAVSEIVYRDICMPSGKSQRAYVPYLVPDFEGIISVKIETSTNVYSVNSEIFGTVSKVVENTPPNPQYVNTGLVYAPTSTPIFQNVTQHEWFSYTAEKTNGVWQYTEHLNVASLQTVLNIQPDEQVPTDRTDVLKSGYGINESVTAVYSSSTDIIAPQTVVAYYPEFYYLNYWRVLEQTADTGRTANFTLKQNPYSHIDARVHFTPLRYPNGTYTAYVTVQDCWTPVGELKQSAVDSIEINGTVFDDWYISKGVR